MASISALTGAGSVRKSIVRELGAANRQSLAHSHSHALTGTVEVQAISNTFQLHGGLPGATT